MLMLIAFIIAVICTIIAIFVINAEITLKVLGNITFKWAFDRKNTNKDTGITSDKSSDYQIQTKGLEKIELKSTKLSKWVGYRLLLLGSCLMLFVGIMYTFSNPQPVAEFAGKVYVDDTKMGLFLINIEVLTIAIFVIISTLKAMGMLDLILGTKKKTKKRVRR